MDRSTLAFKAIAMLWSRPLTIELRKAVRVSVGLIGTWQELERSNTILLRTRNKAWRHRGGRTEGESGKLSVHGDILKMIGKRAHAKYYLLQKVALEGQ